MNLQPTTRQLLLDVNLGVGASGSPVLYRNQNVVGIMVRVANTSTNGNTATGIGIAHPISDVRQQLSEWEILKP